LDVDTARGALRDVEVAFPDDVVHVDVVNAAVVVHRNPHDVEAVLHAFDVVVVQDDDPKAGRPHGASHLMGSVVGSAGLAVVHLDGSSSDPTLLRPRSNCWQAALLNQANIC